MLCVAELGAALDLNFAGASFPPVSLIVVGHEWIHFYIILLKMINSENDEIRMIRNEGTALAIKPCKDLALLTPSLPAKQENNRKRWAEFH
jgi:hypothetical protein